MGKEEAKKELNWSQNMLTSRVSLPPSENPEGPQGLQVSMRNIKQNSGQPSSDLIRSIEPVILDLIRQGRGNGIEDEQIKFNDPSRYIPSLTNTKVQAIISERLTTGDGNTSFIAQSAKDVPQLAYESFFSEQGKVSFPGVSEAIFSVKFEETGEKCLNPSLMRLMMKLFMSYQNEFLVNVIPLMDTYTGINMPTTISIIQDYLYRKLEFSLLKNNVLTLFEEEMDSFVDFYDFQRTRISPDGIEEPISELDPLTASFKEKMKEVIRQYLLRSFDRMPPNRLLNQTPFGITATLGENFLEDEGAIDTYIAWFVSSILGDILFPGDFLTLTQRRVIATIRKNWLDNPQDPVAKNHVLQLATYYTPVSLLYGLYYTSYDFYVPISEEYSFYRRIFESPRQQIFSALKSLKNPLLIPDVTFGIESLTIGSADYTIPGDTIFDEV